MDVYMGTPYTCLDSYAMWESGQTKISYRHYIFIIHLVYGKNKHISLMEWCDQVAESNAAWKMYSFICERLCCSKLRVYII